MSVDGNPFCKFRISILLYSSKIGVRTTSTATFFVVDVLIEEPKHLIKPKLMFADRPTNVHDVISAFGLGLITDSLTDAIQTGAPRHDLEHPGELTQRARPEATTNFQQTIKK